MFGTTKTSAFATDAPSRFASDVLDGVSGNSAPTAPHLMAQPFATMVAKS